MLPDPIVVAPEPHLSARAIRFQESLKMYGITSGITTICDKELRPRRIRTTGDFHYTDETLVLGDDPRGRDCIIVDDMMDTVFASNINII